jgi:hypothetical protein
VAADYALEGSYTLVIYYPDAVIGPVLALVLEILANEADPIPPAEIKAFTYDNEGTSYALTAF